MLQFKNLEINIAGQKTLHQLNLTIPDNSNVILVGSNGAGKTSIFKAILGKQGVSVTSGEILWNGILINQLNIEARVKLGIGLMHQNPPKFSHVSLNDLFCTMGINRDELLEYVELLDLGDLMDKTLNSFSGGEIKRSELLQVLMQHPQLILLDEPESGVDHKHFLMLVNTLNYYLQHHSATVITITHTGKILNEMKIHYGYVLDDEHGLKGSVHPEKCLNKMEIR